MANPSRMYQRDCIFCKKDKYPRNSCTREEDVWVESGVIADGSAAGILEGHSYDRAIRFHKLMFEALNWLAWNGFQRWNTEHHKDKKSCVGEIMKGLKPLNDSMCEPGFQDILRRPLFEEVWCSYFCCTRTTFVIVTGSFESSGCPMLTWTRCYWDW